MSDSSLSRSGTRAARWIFGLAAAYGIPVMLLSYLNPAMATGGQAVTMPEFFYGFTGVVLTWQVVFVLIAMNPIRYRPLMLVAAIREKFLFVGVMIALLLTHRVANRWIAPVAIDAIFGAAFVVAYLATRDTTRPRAM